MRNKFAEAIEQLAEDNNLILLTGDLGFNVFEKVSSKLGKRFINAGVAEQNMIGVAAALAKNDFNVWTYSISPFLYARAFEQIRNDLAFHNLPVHLVGNGAGYTYGVMGPSHHALEDYGVLQTLATYCDFKIFVPAFKEDILGVVYLISQTKSPTYLRLGRCEKPLEVIVPAFEQWRMILEGDICSLVVVGPLAGQLLMTLRNCKKSERPSIWVISQLPLNADDIPENFLCELKRTKQITVVEDHGMHGGVGDRLFSLLQQKGVHLNSKHLYARGYLSGRYGSETFHRKESNLSVQEILNSIAR